MAVMAICRYERSYDLAFVQRRFAGKRFIALNILWHYKEQASFPVCKLAAPHNTCIPPLQFTCGLCPGSNVRGLSPTGTANQALMTSLVFDLMRCNLSVFLWIYSRLEANTDLCDFWLIKDLSF